MDELPTHKLRSNEYRENFNKLVSSFFGKNEGKYLSIIDFSTLTPHDIETAIGWTCVECDGYMVLSRIGTYQFLSFSSLNVCDRVKQLSILVEQVARNSNQQKYEKQQSNKMNDLKSVSFFMEKCFKDTEMDETEREMIKIFVFSRHLKTELKEVFNNNIFELKFQE